MLKQRRFIVILIVSISLLSLSSWFALAQTDGASSNLRIAFVSNRRGNEDIYLMTPNGEADPVSNLTNNPARDWDPAWSPTGDRIIFNTDRDGHDTLYVMSADGSNTGPLFSVDTHNDYDASWSPDGKRIVFASDRAGMGREIFVANSDGTNIIQITDDKTLKGDPIWSPDGTELVFWKQENNGEIHMYRLNPETEAILRITSLGPANGAPVWVGDTIFFDTNREGFWYIFSMASNGDSPERISTDGVNSGRVTVAPDNSRLAFVTDRDESEEIYTMNLDGTSLRRLTENGFSDHSPRWQPAVPDNQLVVAVQPTAMPTEEATEAPSGDGLLGPALGLNISGVVPHPISEQQLLIDYGIAAWHEAGWTGAGQKIGVIDTQFHGLADFQERNGEVAIPPDDSFSSYTTDNGNHGTEVLEVIHLVAPNAELFACRHQGLLDELRECAEWMISRGVKVINHSVGLPILPLNGQSDWAQYIDSLFERDVLWVNSAGNFNQGYVVQQFQDTDQDGYHNFLFGTGSTPVVVTADQDNPYSGNILLSWNDSQFPLYNPETGTEERVDLDLEIVSRITGKPLQLPGTGDKTQDIDPNLSLFEIVYLSDIQEPFEIRVKNAGLPFTDSITFAIFVEYAPLPTNVRALRNAVVSPADARNALAVASVDGNRELADYSSRGLQSDDYTKPDIAAPGEIYLSDGTPFVGTSAAAPVITGIAALLLEQNPALTIDQMPRELKQVWAIPQSSSAYGSGIIQLGPPPSLRLETGVADTPPFIIYPREDQAFVDQGFTCPMLVKPRMEVGIPGYVNFNLGLSIREAPGTQARETANLDFNDQFDVIGGPECIGSSVWWQVELTTGAVGWVSEGYDYYLIAPISLERARLPKVYDTQCPNALTSQLHIGDRALLVTGELFFFRSEGADNQMLPLSGETILSILGGPVCEGNADNVLRWYVRVTEGERTGYEGWVAEGDTNDRFIIPLS